MKTATPELEGMGVTGPAAGQGLRFTHPYWAQVADRDITDLKEALLTGYRSGKPFAPHNYHFFAAGAKARRILDFGCGIGRNFSELRRHGEEVVGFDIPEMIDACRRHGDCSNVMLRDDWEMVRKARFDVGVATLVFQHIHDMDALAFFIRELSEICDFLYVSSRCWIDGDQHPNILQAINDVGCFQYVKGTIAERELLESGFPSEVHVDFLLRSKLASSRLPENDALFDLHTMEYPEVHDRRRITVTQFFTPNFDHWAYKVLDNKRVYCERHGYRFHYRRGLYEHCAERHPSWHRVPLLLALLEESDSEWIFWSDIDSLIMRMDVRLESLLAGHANRDLVIPNQGAGHYLGVMTDNCLCFGQFFLRNSEWSRQFLREVWDFPARPGFEEYITRESWEQEAVNYIYRNDLLDFSAHAAVVPNRLFNSFYHTQYRDGDFLIHFAGEAARGDGRREALVDTYLGCV